MSTRARAIAGVVLAVSASACSDPARDSTICDHVTDALMGRVALLGVVHDPTSAVASTADSVTEHSLPAWLRFQPLPSDTTQVL
jgi:uncharacterized membrane protein